MIKSSILIETLELWNKKTLSIEHESVLPKVYLGSYCVHKIEVLANIVQIFQSKDPINLGVILILKNIFMQTRVFIKNKYKDV